MLHINETSEGYEIQGTVGDAVATIRNFHEQDDPIQFFLEDIKNVVLVKSAENHIRAALESDKINDPIIFERLKQVLAMHLITMLNVVDDISEFGLTKEMPTKLKIMKIMKMLNEEPDDLSVEEVSLEEIERRKQALRGDEDEGQQGK